MDLQFQRSEVTTNDCSIVVGNNAEKPGSAAVAMPVVREQAPRDRCGAVSITGPAPAAQEAAAKRARDVEPGNAGPPTKRMRTTGASSAVQAADFPLQAETGLLAMPTTCCC